MGIAWLRNGAYRQFIVDHLSWPISRRLKAPGGNWCWRGATIAELRAGKICSFRNYFDDAALLEQLFVPEDEIQPW